MTDGSSVETGPDSGLGARGVAWLVFGGDRRLQATVTPATPLPDVIALVSVRPIQKGGNMRIIIKLKSTESSHHYVTTKNKKNDPERLELRKYDPILRRHVLYKESK